MSSHKLIQRRFAFLAFLTTLIFPGAVMGQTEAKRSKGKDPYRLLHRLGRAVSLVEENYFEPVDHAQLLEGALRGMVSGLDPHSSYFNRDDLRIFEGDTQGEFGGIGVEVDFRDGEVVVIAPVAGSPAARAGIGPGDVIVALEDVLIQDLKPHELIRRMRGKVGTKVRITVRKEATDELRDLVLVRERITVSSVLGVPLIDQIGYLRIKSFQAGTHREILEAFGNLRLESSGLQGVILDLRNNPGGLVREATAVADEFLSSGVVYSTRHRGKIIRTARASSGGAFTSGPLVVLINEYSASAAELVAGALRDQGRAILVGARSFGKGSVQTVLSLDKTAAIKLTTALYYTPNGSTLQARGVWPHVRVNPGYIEDPRYRVVRESDLAGHIGPEAEGELPDQGPPPTNEELHLGVLRRVPPDPSQESDLALSVAFRIVRGELPPQPSTQDATP